MIKAVCSVAGGSRALHVKKTVVRRERYARCEAFILDSPGSGAYKLFKVEKFNFIFLKCAISAGAQDICKDQER